MKIICSKRLVYFGLLPIMFLIHWDIVGSFLTSLRHLNSRCNPQNHFTFKKSFVQCIHSKPNGLQGWFVSLEGVSRTFFCFKYCVGLVNQKFYKWPTNEFYFMKIYKIRLSSFGFAGFKTHSGEVCTAFCFAKPSEYSTTFFNLLKHLSSKTW